MPSLFGPRRLATRLSLLVLLALIACDTSAPPPTAVPPTVTPSLPATTPLAPTDTPTPLETAVPPVLTATLVPPAATDTAPAPTDTVPPPAATATPRPVPASTTPHAAKATATSAAGNVVEVQEVDFDFVPRVITVTVGTRIVWTNVGPTDHTIADDSLKLFSSDILHAGDRFSWTADKVGTISYLCTLHPNMKGTIIITK